MLKAVSTYLLRFGRLLRDRLIRFIAERRGLSATEVVERYNRPCVACGRRFTPRATNHFLCADCEDSYIKCWEEDCTNYFEPVEGRCSETYCPNCRSQGDAKDLLEQLIRQKLVSPPTWRERIRQPVFSLPGWVLREKRRVNSERIRAAIEALPDLSED